MNIQFIPSEERQMLKDSVRRWASRIDPRRGELTEDVWTQFVDMGWLAAGLPEEVGGLGGDAYDAATIAEELGRALVRAPFIDVAVTAAHLLLKLAPERVAALASGEVRMVLAHAELEARGDPAWVRTRAIRIDGIWRLSGKKVGILGGADAQAALVSAQVEGGGVTLFEVRLPSPGLREFTTIDGRQGAELLLDDAEATLVGPVGEATQAIAYALDHALILESAEAIGAMQRAFELTRDYLMTRRQFGKRIGEFQALQHRLADMFIHLEQARSLMLRGLAMLDSPDQRSRSMYAAAVKARTAQAGLFVTGHAIQLHGGIGVTEEYVVGHYFKRMIAFNQRHGTGETQVERFADLSRAAHQ